jgi:N-acetylglutamate synthase-like GNAT family acetyltransferase
MDRVEIRIRNAVLNDIPALQELIRASVRELQAEDYTAEQIEGALEMVVGVDSQLIADKTYFVAEARKVEEGSRGKSAGGMHSESAWGIAGCGGWSKRKTLYGGDRWNSREDTLLDPKRDAAKIRAFFVHPAWARRGIGSRILVACEQAASAAGFTRYEMGATLTGAKLFRARGYVAVENIEVPLENGIAMPIIHMVKEAKNGPSPCMRS